MDLKLNFAWNKTAKDNEKVKGNTNVLTKKKRVLENENQKDFIRSIEENTITSSKPLEKEEEIVIPLVQSKFQPLKFRPKPTSASDEVEVKDDLKKEAMEKIIAEAKESNETGHDDNFVIPMTEPGVSEEDREEETVDADYEAVPVSKFGLAALRGMGSKQEIDARLPLAPPMPARRSKGLGLGAVLEKGAARPKGEEGEEEELTVKRGARCCVTKGRLNGRYGTIDAVDGNTDRVIVALAASSGGASTVTVPSVTVRLVTEKEFKKYSKYLNRETAEAFKAQEEARMEQEREKDRAWRAREQEKEQDRSRRKERERRKEEEKRKKERAKEEEERVAKRPREEKREVKSAWVRPRLRVRLVDKSYRGGRYYKEKLVVMDMPSPTVCVCETDNRRILDDVSSEMLETVIPRGDRASVMILRGEYKAELAEIVERDSARCRAIVQLNNEKLLLTFDYDDLCEFVG